MKFTSLASKSSLWQYALKSGEVQIQRGSSLQGRLKERSINMRKRPLLSRYFLTRAPTFTSVIGIYHTLSAKVAKTSKKLKTPLASTLTASKQTARRKDPKIIKKRPHKKPLKMPKLTLPIDM